MKRWTGIVLALSQRRHDEMESRLPTFLHPVAGRPLVWHTVAGLTGLHPAPERIVIVTDVDLPLELFIGLVPEVAVLRVTDEDLPHLDQHVRAEGSKHALVLDATALVLPERLQALLDSAPGHWLATEEELAAAAWVEFPQLSQLFRLPDPLVPPNGVLGASQALAGVPPVLQVRNRAHLAEVVRRVRDRTVQALMRGGVTFLLPDSVVVDVDVRIGRDTVVFPGVVLEGQTTIGEETVIGPGCRIIDSWVGSGVELKGWNYVSHASIRNRAILEPYVRRGFD